LRTIAHSAARVEVHHDARDACRAAADRIATAIGHAVESRGLATLGLATGATPIHVYADLVARQRTGTLSFRSVATYNLDEYYPISPCDPRSYRMFMHRQLFSQVDLPANRAHVLDGSVPEGAVEAHAREFDRWIAADGGLDLQLLGIGRNGHIGFNEPMDLPAAEALRLPTRMIRLAAETRTLYADEFGGHDRVPERALTVGVAPILAARSILVLAFGPAKAEPVALSLTGPMTAAVPGSLLQAAPGRVTWLLDEEAAGLL
jgi:glucosamine-6-phosphate deaminase